MPAAAGLFKFAKQPGHFLRRNALAGIHHLGHEPHFLRRRLDHGHLELHAAVLGEFDGVAQQVAQHLADFILVRLNAQRQGGELGESQGQILGGRALLKQPHQFFQQILGIEHFELQGEPARLDLGQFEHAVEQGEQILPAAADGADLAPGRFGHGGIAQQQLGVAHDGIHGRADLMGHVGQKFRFGAVGGGGGFHGLAQLPLGLLPFGIVENRGPGAQKVAGGIAHGRGVEHHGKHGAILARQLHIHIQMGVRPGIADKIPPEHFPGFGREKIRDFAPDHLVPGIPEPAQLRVIDLHNDAILVQAVVPAGGLVVEVFDLPGPAGRLLLGTLAIRDVNDVGEQIPDAVDFNGFGRNDHLNDFAGLGAVLDLEFLQAPVPGDLFQHLPALFQVGVNMQVQHRMQQHLLAFKPEHPQPGVIHIHQPAVAQAGDGNAQRGAVENLFKTQLGLGQHRLGPFAFGDVNDVAKQVAGAADLNGLGGKHDIK